LLVLLATMVISALITEFAFLFGLKAIGTAFFRFGRLLSVLLIPLVLLPALCSTTERFLNSGGRRLIQIRAERDLSVHPLKTWILRPFQGIGLAMLMATKFLAVLQVYSGGFSPSQTVLPPHQFSLERFVSTTVLAVLVSLLLSFLWTSDDLGIRLFNRKAAEVRRVGKYIGLLLPVFFGFYGLLTLFEENDRWAAAWYMGQMAVILYPPFQIFAALHSRVLRWKEPLLVQRLKAVPGTIRTEGGRISIVTEDLDQTFPKGGSR
jgi:hypothetical protein